MKLSRFVSVFIAATIIFSAVGCVAPPSRIRAWVAPEIVDNMPRRIVVVPFEAVGTRARERMMVTETFADELQGLLLSEMVVAPVTDARLCGEKGLSQRPVINVAALIDARKHYRADAFLFGTLFRYRLYDPPVMGMKIRMIDARTGSLLWAAEILMDATRQDVRVAAERYFRRSGLRDRGFGPELIFTVPRYYAQFVSNAVALDLQARVVSPPEKRKKAENDSGQ